MSAFTKAAAALCSAPKHLLTGMLLICVLIAGSSDGFAQDPELHRLIERAVRQDARAFTSTYLASQFAAWWDRHGARPAMIDSIVMHPDADEIWLSGKDDTATLLLIASKPPARKLLEARKRLTRGQTGAPGPDEAVLTFVEQFAWNFETGNDGFLLDLVFPEHIRLKYRGERDKKSVLGLLREEYGARFKPGAITWERNGSSHTLSIVMDAPLRPLLIQLELQKYLTTRFFAQSDKEARVQSLNREISEFSAGEYEVSTSRFILVPDRASIGAYLDSIFSGYDLAVEHPGPAEMRIEASAQPLFQLRPAPMRFRIDVQNTRGQEVRLEPRPVSNAAGHPLLNDLPKSVRAEAARIADDVIRFYGAAGMPSAFRRRTLRAPSFRSTVTVYSARADTLVLDSPGHYEAAISRLAKDKRCYVFLEEVKREDSAWGVKAYALWQDKIQQWFHLLEISERFESAGAGLRRTHADLAVYPFLRSDYVTTISGLNRPSKLPRQEIKLQR